LGKIEDASKWKLRIIHKIHLDSSLKIESSAVNGCDVFSLFNDHEQLSFSSHEIEKRFIES